MEVKRRNFLQDENIMYSEGEKRKLLHLQGKNKHCIDVRGWKTGRKEQLERVNHSAYMVTCFLCLLSHRLGGGR